MRQQRRALQLLQILQRLRQQLLPQVQQLAKTKSLQALLKAVQDIRRLYMQMAPQKDAVELFQLVQIILVILWMGRLPNLMVP
jgi:hypothetical protein